MKFLFDNSRFAKNVESCQEGFPDLNTASRIQYQHTELAPSYNPIIVHPLDWLYHDKVDNIAKDDFEAHDKDRTTIAVLSLTSLLDLLNPRLEDGVLCFEKRIRFKYSVGVGRNQGFAYAATFICSLISGTEFFFEGIFCLIVLN